MRGPSSSARRAHLPSAVGEVDDHELVAAIIVVADNKLDPEEGGVRMVMFAAIAVSGVVPEVVRRMIAVMQR